jgi:hypothetical protein
MIAEGAVRKQRSRNLVLTGSSMTLVVPLRRSQRQERPSGLSNVDWTKPRFIGGRRAKPRIRSAPRSKAA